jgi:hypothetical protein
MSLYDFLSTRRIRGRFHRPKDLYVLNTSADPLESESNESEDEETVKHAESFFEMSWEDKCSVMLLLMLYTLQGYHFPLLPIS